MQSLRRPTRVISSWCDRPWLEHSFPALLKVRRAEIKARKSANSVSEERTLTVLQSHSISYFSSSCLFMNIY